MMIGTAIRTHLLTVSGLTALIGQRIYPVTLPQNPTLPCITYQLVTEPRDYTMEGREAPQPYIQIDCWGSTYLQAEAVGIQVSTALSGFRGLLGGAINVSACLQRARREIFEDETQEFRISLDFIFWHN